MNDMEVNDIMSQNNSADSRFLYYFSEHTQSVEASFEQYGEEEDVLYATCVVSVTDKDYCTVRSGTSSIMHPKLYITVRNTYTYNTAWARRLPAGSL